jgi:NhaP-type Na+/H+ or K+/H+ antiporter
MGILVGLLQNFTASFSKNVKAFICLLVAFCFVVFSEISGFHEAKYMGVIVFGYLCFRMWGHNKPEEELATIWQYFMPFLFGTVGAAIKFSNIKGSDIFKGLIVIILGVSTRWLAVLLATCQKKYTLKERMFMGFSWIPKATVQAAIGGIVLETALSNSPDADSLIPYGETILTTAVLSVVLTAPLGAILTNTLGPMWLAKKKPEVSDAELETEAEKFKSKYIDTEIIHVKSKSGTTPEDNDSEKSDPKSKTMSSPDKY